MLALATAAAEGRLAGEVALVVSNVADAPGLRAAEDRGLAVAVRDHRGLTRERHDAAVAEALERAAVDLVCLAGYMRLLSPAFVRRFEGRILNVHPSLLPAFPGLHAQRQALRHGARVTGCTVHFVDEELDHGPIVLQGAVDVRDDDTEESLSARILEVEHRLYPRAVDLLARGALRIEGRRVLGTGSGPPLTS